MLNKLVAGSLLFLALAQRVVSAATPTTSLHLGPGPAKVFLFCSVPLRRALLRNELRHRLPGVATVVPYSPAAAILSAMNMMNEKLKERCVFASMLFYASDEALTLVNPTPGPIFLTFGTDSMLSATLFLNGRPAYTISTALAGSPTELRTAGTSSDSEESEPLARIACNAFLPDTIAFPASSASKMRLSKWLRRCTLADGLEVHMIETDAGKCVLKPDLVHRLALFAEHDLQTPVAHWQRRAAGAPLSPVLYAGTESFRAQIIAAFIVLELRMRMAEKAEGTLVPVGRAAILATTPLAMLNRRN
ncbi:hypothetical protein C8R44DRAFT_859494 [Mycena epipterygia]|nr:hypothetical protein C8R44DRAFT_859494 [Mycena epipterygia]